MTVCIIVFDRHVSAMPTIQIAYSDSIAVCTVRIVHFVSDIAAHILMKRTVHNISMIRTVIYYLRDLKGTD